MPEIILLFFMCRKIGKIAREKNMKPLRWQIFTVITFFIFEGLGVNLSLSWLGLSEIKDMSQATNALISHPGIFLFSLFAAFGGYLIVIKILESRPGNTEEKTNQE